MIYWLLALLVLWVLFNWLAPLSLLAFSERMSIGRIPPDILKKAKAHHVQYYISNLTKGYAFSTWLGWKHAVVLDRGFLREGTPAQIRFVLAHELGHCALGHLRLRWLCVVTGAILFPSVRGMLVSLEKDADAFGENLSGTPRAVLVDWKLGVQPSPATKKEFL